MISAKVIAHSIFQLEQGPQEIITMVLRFPRFILPEFNTHRVFSRNAASSRAIPIQKVIDKLIAEPVLPVSWGKNRPGMQSSEVLSSQEEDEAVKIWLEARDSAIQSAQKLIKLNVHKQIVNRLLEPWMYSDVIVTSTEWSNFYNLRDHKDAQPEIAQLAREMKKAVKKAVTKIASTSSPTILQPHEWHIPFASPEDLQFIRQLPPGESSLPWQDDRLLTALKRSAAKCARVSYLKHDGTQGTAEEDLKLFDRLVGGDVIHASPLEHQATGVYLDEKHRSNLQNLTQFRKIIENQPHLIHQETNTKG